MLWPASTMLSSTACIAWQQQNTGATSSKELRSMLPSRVSAGRWQSRVAKFVLAPAPFPAPTVQTAFNLVSSPNGSLPACGLQHVESTKSLSEPACMSVCARVHACVVSVCECVYVCIYIYIYIYACVRACVRACAHGCVFVRVCFCLSVSVPGRLASCVGGLWFVHCFFLLVHRHILPFLLHPI